MNLFNFQKSAPRFAAVVLNCLTVAALIFSAAFISCGGKGSGGDVKLLESITDDSGNVLTKFEYDGQNRIVKRYEYSEGKLSSTTTVTYTDNLVTVKENNGEDVKKYVINGDTVTEGSTTLTVNKDGTIDGIFDENWECGCAYRYQDGNLIEGQCCVTTTYYKGYDNKKSPFSNSGTPKWLFKHLSKNNVLEKRVPDGDGMDEAHSARVQYEYEYDGDGFPTKQTEKMSGIDFEEMPPTIRRFTYLGGTKTPPPKAEPASGEKEAAAIAPAAPESIAAGENISKLVPAGYSIEMEARGDLNGDGADDLVLMVKGTDKDNVVTAREDYGPRDVNAYGVMIFFNDGGGYRFAAENRKFLGPNVSDCETCASSEFSCEIKKGNLYINFSHYGRFTEKEKKLTFRYKNSEFELVGYDVIMDGNKESREETSVNLSTKKKLVKTCVSVVDEEYCEMCTPRCKFKEKWGDVSINGPVLLRKLAALNDVDGYIVDIPVKSGSEGGDN
ncbi:MAG: hypothetical protein LBB74_10260 [Chitinispirillales bacterium]|jgi:hypothetical protein|nr:hypothetical protein [Chitinispirillales bacterium]